MWTSVGAFIFICSFLTLDSVELPNPLIWVRGLWSKARRSRGWRAVSLWAAVALLEFLVYVIYVVALPAAFSTFGYIVAVFAGAMLIVGLGKPAMAEISRRVRSGREV
jgi:hypothetical protein